MSLIETYRRDGEGFPLFINDKWMVAQLNYFTAPAADNIRTMDILRPSRCFQMKESGS